MNDIPQFKNETIRQENHRTLRKGLFSNLSLGNANTFMIEYFIAQTGENKGKLISPYTGKIIEQKNLSLEHILQVREGGGTTLWNCIPLEISLNIKRNKTDIITFFKQMNFETEKLKNIVNYMLDALIYEYIEQKSNFQSDYIKKEIKYYKSSGYDINKDDNPSKEKINIYIQILLIMKYIKENNLDILDLEYKIEKIKEAKVFEQVEECEKYEKILFNIIKSICPAMKYSIVLAIDFPKLINSVGNLSNEEFKVEILKRINNAHNIFKHFGCSIETTIGTIKEMPEIIVEPYLITKEYIEANIDKIYLSDLHKKQFLFEILKMRNGTYPIDEKFINGTLVRSFLLMNMEKQICSDKKLRIEVEELRRNLGIVELDKDIKFQEFAKKIVELKGRMPKKGEFQFEDGTDYFFWYHDHKEEKFDGKDLKEIINEIKRNFGKGLKPEEKKKVFFEILMQNNGKLPQQPKGKKCNFTFSDGKDVRTWYDNNMLKKINSELTLLEEVQKIQEQFGIKILSELEKKEIFFERARLYVINNNKVVIDNLGFFEDGTSIDYWYHHNQRKKIKSTITLAEEFNKFKKSLDIYQTDFEKKEYLFSIIRAKRGLLPLRKECNGGKPEYVFKDGIDVMDWYRRRLTEKIGSKKTLQEEVKEIQLEFGYKKLTTLEKKEMLFAIIKKKNGTLPKLKTHNNNQSEYVFPDGKDIRKWYDHNRKNYIGNTENTLEEEVKMFQKRILLEQEMEIKNGRRSL